MFSYLAEIVALTFLGFGSIYPLLLWLTPKALIDEGFYRFNQGMASIVIAIGMIFIYISLTLYNNTYIGVFWIFLQLVTTAIYWNKKNINNIYISIPPFIGIIYLLLIMSQILHVDIDILDYIIIFISFSIIAIVFFSMILGHWYLNVIALPISLLKKSTTALSAALAIRIIWDVFFMTSNLYVDSYGITKNSWSFLFDFDGILLLVALFMGNIFPAFINYFVWSTLKIQATQSATGLLYVSIISILFGDIIFKFYLLQYRLPL